MDTNENTPVLIAAAQRASVEIARILNARPAYTPGHYDVWLDEEDNTIKQYDAESLEWVVVGKLMG